MIATDSTATLPPVDTTASAGTKRKLTTGVTGEPAPPYDGKNLFIKIDVGSDTAKFHCQETEHVGTPPNRHVRFQADANCELHFTACAVFGIPLEKGKPIDLPVLDQTSGVQTSYYIVVDAAKNASVKEAAQPVPKGPPVIVVP